MYIYYTIIWTEYHCWCNRHADFLSWTNTFIAYHVLGGKTCGTKAVVCVCNNAQMLNHVLWVQTSDNISNVFCYYGHGMHVKKFFLELIIKLHGRMGWIISHSLSNVSVNLHIDFYENNVYIYHVHTLHVN